jgi:uncharacterized protein
MLQELIIFALVGFGAQIVDGALGMAYGVVSSSALLALGIPPSHASASVHAAEIFTTATSAGSHVAHKNVDWKMFWPLAISGVIGGIFGAYVLTSFDGNKIKPVIVIYLGVMGCVILYRAWKGKGSKPISPKLAAPLGLVGGFCDAAGGGGWGPTVTSTLVGSGASPRHAVGTVNTAEFLVTTAVSATFLGALLSGHWVDSAGIGQHLTAVIGLIIGGVIAAPLAGKITKHVPVRAFTWAVGALVVVLAIYQALRLFKVI